MRFKKNIFLSSLALLMTTTLFILVMDSANVDSNELARSLYVLFDQVQFSSSKVYLDTRLFLSRKDSSLYCDRSMLFARAGKNKEALEDINKAISLRPFFADLYYKRASILIVCNSYKEALNDCETASKLDPKLASAFYAMALAYERLGNYGRALEFTDRAIKIDSSVFRFFVLRATINRHLGKYQSGILDCNRALMLQKTVEEAYVERGYINLQLGKTESAISDYTVALKINHFNPGTYALRGEAYGKLGQYKNQILDITKAIGLSPKSAALLESRGYVYFSIGQYQQALIDFTRAIELSPRSPKLYLRRAAVFNSLGLLKKEVEDLNTSESLGGLDSDSYVNRANANHQLGYFDKSIKDYTLAILQNPKCTNVYLQRAESFHKIGQYHREMADLLASEKNDPVSATDVLERKCRLYYDLWDLEKTVSDCSKLIRKNPNSEMAFDISASAYKEMGLYSESLKALNAAIRLKPSSAMLIDRAKLNQMLGNSELARKDWEKAINLATPTVLASLLICNPLSDLNKNTGEGKFGFHERYKQNCEVLPFYYDSVGHICVPITIDGHHFDFMLDTGCCHSNLWKSALPGETVLEKIRLRESKASGQESAHPFFVAKELKLGKMLIKNVPFVVDDGLIEHETLSGFLGGNILENFVVKIDFSEKLIFLGGSINQVKVKKGIKVPLLVRNHRPYCSFRLNDKFEVMGLIDTGSLSNIASDALLEPLLPKKLELTDQVYGPWLGHLDISKVTFKKLSVKNINTYNPQFKIFPAKQAPDAGFELTVASTFLRKFKSVTFDYLNNQLILEPY